MVVSLLRVSYATFKLTKKPDNSSHRWSATMKY